jgi:hypothetical protein
MGFAESIAAKYGLSFISHEVICSGPDSIKLHKAILPMLILAVFFYAISHKTLYFVDLPVDIFFTLY